MSSAAVTVNNPVQSSTYQPKQQQRQTAKDVIAENVKALIAQLEAGKSDALTAYLDAMARFHNYSFGNILAIARQRLVTYCYTSLESINIRVCGSPSSINGNAKRVHHTVVPHC
jgi:hypothetical protein